MQKRFIEEFIIDKIMKRCNVSKSTASKLYKNSLQYNVVVDAILEQVDFLLESNVELV